MLISPAVFSLLGFSWRCWAYCRLHPKTAHAVHAGIALAMVGGGIGYFFHTTII